MKLMQETVEAGEVLMVLLVSVVVAAAGAEAGVDGVHMHDAVAEAPEECLAFALSDGRVGVLAVKGRKVGASYLWAHFCPLLNCKTSRMALACKVVSGHLEHCMCHGVFYRLRLSGDVFCRQCRG